ncbi:MAG: M48 family metallopeptidase [Candidatus Omnitrophica bacterium]|nr:M48 family metallopeptidase [Candidatus Omnitrophota bacterium]
MQDKAKRYSNIKYTLTVIESAYILLLLFLFLSSGLSGKLSIWLNKYVLSYIVVPAYLAVVSIGYYFLNLPLEFYQSYILEHRFSLSTQSLRDWSYDQLKTLGLSFLVSLILVMAFYIILRYTAAYWWLAISAFWIFFSIILAKVLPVLVIPLFFKYKKLSDELLRERIMKLAERMNVKLLDCFEIDFSKKTLKANAAFVGVGNTRRVILADTLKDKYSYDEIEVILAHEFAHCRLKHLLKLIVINSLSILVIFYLIARTSIYALNLFGLASLSDIASLPLIFIYFILLSVIAQPLEAFVSRSFERSADSLALETTGLKDAFISTMNKLSEQNLSDRSPNPIIKFFFFDHPPIDERINSAKDY